MELAELLDVRPGVTAVVGSGGKTTLLRTLGTELARSGHTVLLCATTKLFPFDGLPNLISPAEDALADALSRHRLVCAGTPVPGTGKLTAPDIPMARLASLAEYVLAEADGSAGRPLKAHAPWEPVIPPETGQTVCVVGLSGLGRPIEEAAHRPERYARLAGVSPETPVTADMAAAVLRAEGPGWRFFINQADTPERWAWARELASLLPGGAAVGSLQKGAYFPCWS